MRYLSTWFGIILTLGCLQGEFLARESAQFRSDDPLLVDSDQNPVPRPEKIRLSQIYDLVENTFINRPKTDESMRAAVNVNTLGEVPDSSWFTNRMGKRVMTVDELIRGPNQLDGPDQNEGWTIVGAKTEGVTPGFTIRDGRGDTYFVKFDPPNYPQLMTSTEVIVTKFFHAFGYNVPENYFAFILRDDLLIGKGAQLIDEEGKERNLTKRDIGRIFEKVCQGSDGKTPVMASRRLDGFPLGPFKYLSVRSDDPNDIFAHEDRRELRGLRLFCAWLNHDDSRSVNSLDSYLGEPGEGYVKHHLIDFGSCLGSGSVKPQSRRAGNEYIIDWSPILKATLTLGIWDRPWRHVKYPNYPSVGRFEGDFFEPHLWRPEYPNSAFERMLPEDAFWAVRIIMRFNDKMVRALVETGQISDPDAEEYLVQTIIKRRDKIVRHYLAQINSLDEFRVSGPGDAPVLEFRHLAGEAGLVPGGPYEYRWFDFFNNEGSFQALDESGSSGETLIPVPRSDSEFLMTEITARSNGSIGVYLRKGAGGYRVVGVDRDGDQPQTEKSQ